MDFLNYYEYIKKDIDFKGILFAKVKGKYLIGPLVDDTFDKIGFVKRINSSVIYLVKDYKKVSKRVMKKLYELYGERVTPSVVLEIRKNEMIEHKLLRLEL